MSGPENPVTCSRTETGTSRGCGQATELEPWALAGPSPWFRQVLAAGLAHRLPVPCAREPAQTLVCR